LNVERIEADLASGELNNHEGFGVYINDGTYQEVVYFYEDRIRLFYANVYASLSNTYDRDFAIVGKGQNLFIYQKLANAPFGSYNKIIDGAGLFSTPATKSGNSSKSKVIRGSSLNTYHSVWHDDGNGRSQIMYSTYNGSAWSDPELVTVTTQFHLRNPDLALDSTGRVWVAYEDTSWGNTEISISVLDNAGWNPRVRLTNSFGVKRTPTIQVDSDDNVHVAWEDDRNGNSVIMWALWNNETQTWNSSGQFGEDTIIMQFYSEDPYQDPYGPDEYNEYGDSKPMAFKCPKLTMNYPRLYIIAEADFVETNQSMIYGGYYDLLSKIWNSSGSTILENGEAIGTGSGFLISPISANAKNPSVASSFSGDMAVCWEDHSAAIVQVGVALMDMYGAIYDHYVNITNSIDNNCTNPAVGWSTNYAFIAYEKNNNINILTFNSSTHSFSATTSINTEEGISCRSPAMPEYLISGTVMCTYESSNQSDSEYLSNAELQNYYTINSATISGTGPVYVSSSTLVSSLDTKEFAFGDFSDIAGLKSHWKDFKFYFGYDAHPYSISKFNKTTISNWPDDRVNDVFVDVFGNIIAATFGGLVYHNVITGKSTIIEELKDKTITAITWGGNGIWFTGTTNGAYLSADAGQTWQQFVGSGTIYAIAADNLGRATVASSEGVIVYDPSTAATVATISLSAIAGTSAAKSVAVDENNIIWAGTDKGLVRIENFTNFLLFSRKNGMRSSHINDIAIVNKHLRYIATPSGIERMYGVNFTNMNVNNAELLNDNVLTVRWHGLTNSLWAGCLYKLHEIVFRDQAHEIIENEVVYYDNTEISTENTLDTSVYYVLDLDSIQSDSSNPLKLTTETTSVYLNKHKIDAGYTVDEIGQTVEFSTELLVSDQVEIEISNRFTKYHDFNQFDIEKEVLGEKRTSILKMDRTSQNQLLVMSDIDKHSLMFLADEQARLPFCTILLDKDPPIGCLEKIDQITKTQLKFRIYAYDELSGVESYMLSNYANFTSDGTTELEFQPLQSLVVHDIGSNINNVYDSLVFPDTVEIEGTTYTVGTGSSLGAISFYANQNITLFAGTSGPSIVFRYDTTEETWEAVVNLDVGDLTRRINDMQTINNVLWITTGTDVGNGGIYRTFDGVVFELVQSVTGTDARGIAATSEGSIYFGSSDGKLYKYKNNVMSQEFGGEAVADSIYSLAIMQDKLIIGTGNKGRIYTIDLTTNNSLIIFSGADTHINNVLIQGAETGSTDTAQLFATSGNNTTIYRSNLTSFDFAKSYTSVGEDMGRLRSITTNTVTDQATTGSTATVAGNSVLAAIGSKLFKYTSPSWQYFYQHDETINDFMEYSPGDKSAVWIISDSKVTKWTNTLTTKTVYLRLKDKAGNITPAPMTDTCPVEGSVICCDTQDETTQQAIAGVAYSINIEDLKDFVNESRIVDVSEYGEVTFTYSSPYQNLFYSADKIDEEIGIYTSEVLNGSNDLVSWKSIAWVSVEPSETSVEFQIRSAISEDLASEAEWSEVLTGGNVQEISLEHITDQYMQFRAVLKSKVRNSSPSLSSVVLRSITSQASHFFTTNFVMPSRPTKGLLTANTFIPVSSDIVFGINTTNSTNFSEYQQIEVNRLFSLTNDQFGSNLRIGAKLLSPAASSINPTVYPGSEYDESSYVCSIDFNYTNPSSSDSNLFHFRAKFYSDVSRTLLSYTFFSSNDQTGWTYDGSVAIPGTGVSLSASETQAISFTPGDQVDATIKWYVEIDAYYDGSFTNISDNKSFVCTTATEYEYENPKIYNFALVFELENGDHVKLNLT
jgi:hypothetical protein